MVYRIGGCLLLVVVMVLSSRNIAQNDGILPTPAHAATPISQVATNQQVHIVQVGENLHMIATRYNVSLSDITAANQLADPSLIYVGQALVIPAQPTPTPRPNIATLTPSPTVIPITHEPTYSYFGFEIIPTPIPTHPMTINEMPYDEFILLAPDVIQHVREIYARGQMLGRNPTVFTRLGDSIIEYPVFLTRFDEGTYNLGDYRYLQRVINIYAGSFDHDSIAVIRGLHSWSVLDPMWADNRLCLSGEHMLACEFRRENPSLIFIRLGTNDRGIPDITEESFRQILDVCIENGVIPVLETKADRFDGYGSPNNGIIRALAAEYAVPLWDFDILASTLPRRGLDLDGVHLTAFFAHDWTQARGFTTGHGLHNLVALIVLDEIQQILNR